MEPRAWKAATERSSEPELAHEGQRSATWAVMELPLL